MIAIPHGLAAEVLRALQDGPRTTGQIVDAIDLARGRSEEEPGVGLAPVWMALWAMFVPIPFSGARFVRRVSRTDADDGHAILAWELRR